MKDSKFMSLTVSTSSTSFERKYKFIGSLNYQNLYPQNNLDSDIQKITYGQRNVNLDDQIIHYANGIAQDWRRNFGEDKYGNDYAFGLYQTFNEVKSGQSRLNKRTQEYVNQNFKNEQSFRCYYMQHKNSPKSDLGVNA